MKRLYWRPAGASWRSLALLSLLAIALLLVAESFPREVRARDYEAKLRASELAARAFSVLREERERRGHPVDDKLDPTHTGLVGMGPTAITSSAGSLRAKQTTQNPNFAAVVVDYLNSLGLRRGDVVAVGCSGSFPALNVAVLAAADTLGLEPLIVTSAAASDFGANFPDFTWLDMERVLVDKGLVRHRSVAASLGGIEDRGLGVSQEGRRLLEQAIARSGAERVDSEDFEDAIAKRMELYDRAARGRAIRAYVNVGGGALSVGRRRGKLFYSTGINRPEGRVEVDSVIGRFLERGVPVVHLVHVERLAEEHGLPAPPTTAQEPGEGVVFQRSSPNRLLVIALLLVLGSAIGFVGKRSRARAHLKQQPRPERESAA